MDYCRSKSLGKPAGLMKGKCKRMGTKRRGLPTCKASPLQHQLRPLSTIITLAGAWRILAGLAGGLPQESARAAKGVAKPLPLQAEASIPGVEPAGTASCRPNSESAKSCSRSCVSSRATCRCRTLCGP